MRVRPLLLSAELLCSSASLVSATHAADTIPHGLSRQAFLQQPQVQRRLTLLLGAANFRRVLVENGQVGQLQDDAHITAFLGCAASACGENDNVVIYSRDQGCFKVLLHVNSRQRRYQECSPFESGQYAYNLKTSLMNLFGSLN